MLKPHKRITKRQLKEDKFVTYYFKAIDFVEKYSRHIVIGLGAVVLVSAALFYHTKKQAEKDASAVVELSKAHQEYASSNYESATVILKNLIENYGGTKSAELAKFYLANNYFELKSHSEAEKYYRDFADDNDDDVLTASALAGVAACLEEQGKFAEAADMYKKIADEYPDGVFAAENLFHSARCYLLAGNQQAARDTLSKLREKYPDSTLENDAQVLLAELAS